MKKGKEYKLPDLRLKNGRKLKVTVSFTENQEEAEWAFSQAVRSILNYKG